MKGHSCPFSARILRMRNSLLRVNGLRCAIVFLMQGDMSVTVRPRTAHETASGSRTGTRTRSDVSGGRGDTMHMWRYRTVLPAVQ